MGMSRLTFETSPGLRQNQPADYSWLARAAGLTSWSLTVHGTKSTNSQCMTNIVMLEQNPADIATLKRLPQGCLVRL